MFTTVSNKKKISRKYLLAGLCCSKTPSCRWEKREAKNTRGSGPQPCWFPDNMNNLGEIVLFLPPFLSCPVELQCLQAGWGILGKIFLPKSWGSCCRSPNSFGLNLTNWEWKFMKYMVHIVALFRSEWEFATFCFYLALILKKGTG